LIAITSLLITLTLSLLVTRIAAMALMLTGLSREAAKFQARSAFSGVGFTTSEAESIVNHPVRRQIVMMLMLLGNIGVATVVATIMISFIDLRQGEDSWLSLGFLAAGLSGLWAASRSRWLERRLNKWIAWSLRRFARLDVRDYVALLNLRKGYAVSEMKIERSDWLANKTLLELNLPKEGILVLGIQRPEGNRYIGTPRAQTKVLADDNLVLYGRIERLEELTRRRAGRQGDAAHREAVSEHSEELIEQEQEEQIESEPSAQAASPTV
jgi:hypothetical protein